MNTMTLLFDPAATTYSAPYHPERPARLTATAHLFREKYPGWAWLQPRLATTGEILAVHTVEHLARLDLAEDFDSDTPYYQGIKEHAQRAAGAAVQAVDLALEGKPAFSLMRPPGHHAIRDRAMGFCYLNHVAIAAFYALSRGVSRVGIWDFDAHHGNGTEAIVKNNARIRFTSVHQYPGYPGTGSDSFGNIFNWPVPPHGDPRPHVDAIRAALDRLIEFQPNLLLVSAGFDAFAGDPITEMSLESDHFREFGQWIRKTGLPAAALLEGGYSGELPKLIEAFLVGWQTEP